MENIPYISTSHLLSIERQLLREEKYLVSGLKTAIEERHALENEKFHLAKALEEVLNAGKSKKVQGKAQAMEEVQTELHTGPSASVAVPSTANVSFLEEFQLDALDDLVNSDVELNLTVPKHNLHDYVPEEEYDEIEAEDDFEIEMSMLMNGDKAM